MSGIQWDISGYAIVLFPKSIFDAGGKMERKGTKEGMGRDGKGNGRNGSWSGCWA